MLPKWSKYQNGTYIDHKVGIWEPLLGPDTYYTTTWTPWAGERRHEDWWGRRHCQPRARQPLVIGILLGGFQGSPKRPPIKYLLKYPESYQVQAVRPFILEEKDTV